MGDLEMALTGLPALGELRPQSCRWIAAGANAEPCSKGPQTDTRVQVYPCVGLAPGYGVLLIVYLSTATAVDRAIVLGPIRDRTT